MSFRPELSSMDKDAILFLRKNKMALAFHWDFYKTHRELVSQMFLNDIPTGVYYKCSNAPGLESWVDFNKSLDQARYDNVKALVDIDDQTKEVTILRNYEQCACDAAFANGNYLASYERGLVFPQAEYFDAEGYRYRIGINDGTMTYVQREKLTAGGDDNKPITISQGSIANRSIPWRQRHLMEDIKLKFNGSTPANTIITLNSQMLPVVQDMNDESIGWIREGLRMSSFMNNDFTKSLTFSIPEAFALVNPQVNTPFETTKATKLNGYEPRSRVRFFYDNTKQNLFGFNLYDGTLKRASSPDGEWTDVTIPALCKMIDSTNDPAEETEMKERILVVPIPDKNKTTNILVAFEIAEFSTSANISYERYMAISTNGGTSWTKKSYEELFGYKDAILVPIYLPGGGLYVLSSANDYTSLIRTYNGTSWVELHEGDKVVDSIKAPNITNLRKFVLAGFHDEKFLTLNDVFEEEYGIEDYLYGMCHAGDLATYNDSVFAFGPNLEMWINNVNTGWKPVVDQREDRLTLDAYWENFEGDESTLHPMALDIRALDGYANSAVRYVNLQSYEKRPDSTVVGAEHQQMKININVWSVKYDENYMRYKVVTNTKRINKSAAFTVYDVNNLDEDKASLAPNPMLYVNGKYLGYTNVPNSFETTDVTSGSDTLKTKKLITTMEIKDDELIFEAMDIGEKYKFVFVSEVIGHDNAFGYMMNHLLFDGKDRVLMIGDFRDAPEEGQLPDPADTFVPFIFDYKLKGDINYHYDLRVKAYRWIGVKCTQQIKARYINDPHTGNNVSSSSGTPIKIGFPIKINPNAFLLIYNGIPITDGSAYVNPKNPNEILCENLQRYRAMQEYLNPIQYKENMRDFIYSDFTVINFTAEDPTKECHMFIDRAFSDYYGKTCHAKFHSDIAGDLVLFNGIDHEYIISPKSKRDIEFIISRHGLSEAVYTFSPYNHIGAYNVRLDIPRNIIRIQFALIDK